VEVRTTWLHRHFMIGSDDHLLALGLLTVDFGAADEALADYRNDIVHGWVKWDSKTRGE